MVASRLCPAGLGILQEVESYVPHDTGHQNNVVSRAIHMLAKRVQPKYPTTAFITYRAFPRVVLADQSGRADLSAVSVPDNLNVAAATRTGLRDAIICRRESRSSSWKEIVLVDAWMPHHDHQTRHQYRRHFCERMGRG